MTVIGLGFALYLLAEMREDLAYWVADPTPAVLGAPKDYHPERAQHGQLATVEGTPGSSAERFDLGGKRWELVGLAGTPFVVQRELPATAGKDVDQRPVTATGKVLQDARAPAFYQPAFLNLLRRGQVEPYQGHLYVVVDGDRPRSGWRTPLIALALLALVAFNVRSLFRALRARSR